jgi:hypothetical protein
MTNDLIDMEALDAAFSEHKEWEARKTKAERLLELQRMYCMFVSEHGGLPRNDRELTEWLGREWLDQFDDIEQGWMLYEWHRRTMTDTEVEAALDRLLKHVSTQIDAQAKKEAQWDADADRIVNRVTGHRRRG